MTRFTEAHLEEATISYLQELGYAHKHGPAIAPDSADAERVSYGDVILLQRLKAALARLNPTFPPDAHEDTLRTIQQAGYPILIEENKRLHQLMLEGVPVQFYGEDGVLNDDRAKLINFDDPEANDWLVVNQFTVVENGANRRADVVLFVNGLPLGVIELKNPSDANADIDSAYNQLQTYKAQIPSLFHTNVALVISDGMCARIGSLTTDRERFMPWRTVEGRDIAPKGTPELETALKGVFEKRRFLDLLRHFTVFSEVADKDGQSKTVKILAGYHQFHAVQHAVESTITATNPNGNRRIGVIWHTQGSGKSLLMAFYAGLVTKSTALKNPTLVILTDRNDLDEQLFATFSMCKELLRQTPIQAESTAHLRELLNRPSGGVIFTTIQKFAPVNGERDFPLLTDRRNVVVIADEAHRSQYGFKAKVAMKGNDLAVSYGFAKYLRDALPNASFIGFTGTPVEKGDVSTRAVFGEDIDVYDITRAVEDGATVPIYYESRLVRVELPEDQKSKIDQEIAALTEDLEEAEENRLSQRLSSVEQVVGSPSRLHLVAADLVKHFEERVMALDGKVMVVCMSRRIAVAFYDKIIELKPEWHSDNDDEGVVKVVMTGSASDPENFQPHIGRRAKARRELIAKRAKNPQDALKLVIVRDMWLTGFDAPCMHTMYIDKPMQGHNLMQAIARVNRVFRDKPAGLVVDYIGIAQNLKSALSIYSQSDRSQVGIEEQEAIDAMLEKYEIVREMFKPDATGGYDYRLALEPHSTARQRFSVMAGAIDWILGLQQQDAAKETTAEGKKKALRRFDDTVVTLSKAYALAAASEAAQDIRDEVGFFQAIRIALNKNEEAHGPSLADRELAIRQIVSQAFVSKGIVDIMATAGLGTQDISILSDEFLVEVQNYEKKNLALEALRKLISGEVKARGKINITQSRLFSERLETAIARYHSNAITTVQVIEELIKLAKDLKAAHQRGEETGLNEQEIAFYDALAENQSARETIGEPELRIIAFELLNNLKSNITADWMHREAARARLRVLVKRILRKYGYPPDLQDSAIQVVLAQAEKLSSSWAQGQ